LGEHVNAGIQPMRLKPIGNLSRNHAATRSTRVECKFEPAAPRLQEGIVALAANP
jgi:hypothetical protein